MELPVIDKIAVVFHGIIGGSAGRNGVGEPNDIELCARTIKNVLLKDQSYDVFVHSWSTEYGDLINSLYHPVISSFEPQEYFGFKQEQISSAEVEGQAYRTISRYTSLFRALDLKNSYENFSGFRYKWVLVLRFDLVFFNTISFDTLDPSNFYLCFEPHWADMENWKMFHDIVFLSNAENMNNYATILDDLISNKYSPSTTHIATYNKLIDLFGDLSKIKYGFRRYEDVEIYRMIMNPALNLVGHAYGVLETKSRLLSLIEII